jgi:DNA primase
VNLTRLMKAQGLTLTSQGKDLACRCPWHEGDDTPSCVITPATNLWHCFGCDAGGTVIDWVMRSQRVSFRHACELLMDEGTFGLSRRIYRYCGAKAVPWVRSREKRTCLSANTDARL